MSELSEDDIARLRDQLETLRAEIDASLATTADAARPVDLDQPIGRISRVDALQQQSMVAAGRAAARVRRQRVDAALHRIAEDAYGDCARCGEPISPRRLEAQPEAPLCITCQGLRER